MRDPDGAAIHLGMARQARLGNSIAQRKKS
jgi:hypothetical protein